MPKEDLKSTIVVAVLLFAVFVLSFLVVVLEWQDRESSVFIKTLIAVILLFLLRIFLEDSEDPYSTKRWMGSPMILILIGLFNPVFPIHINHYALVAIGLGIGGILFLVAILRIIEAMSESEMEDGKLYHSITIVPGVMKKLEKKEEEPQSIGHNCGCLNLYTDYDRNGKPVFNVREDSLYTYLQAEKLALKDGDMTSEKLQEALHISHKRSGSLIKELVEDGIMLPPKRTKRIRQKKLNAHSTDAELLGEIRDIVAEHGKCPSIVLQARFGISQSRADTLLAAL